MTIGIKSVVGPGRKAQTVAGTTPRLFRMLRPLHMDYCNIRHEFMPPNTRRSGPGPQSAGWRLAGIRASFSSVKRHGSH